MKSFDYDVADYMTNLVIKFNSYTNELGWKIEKYHTRKEYLYHSAYARRLDLIIKNGLVQYNTGIDDFILGSGYTRTTLPSYMKIKNILHDLKVIYLGLTLDDSIYETYHPNAGDFNSLSKMFRVKTKFVEKYLYRDPENKSEALMTLINIPPKYLEIGIPNGIKRIDKKTKFEYYKYKWVDFADWSKEYLKHR